MSRALLRSVLELRAPVTRLLPLSIRPTTTTAAAAPAAASVRFFNQTAQHIEPTTQPDPTIVANNASPPDSVRTLLPILAAQPGHYITLLIHGRPYLVTQGDSIRLPFKMPGVEPGDVLRLNRASVLGSRDFTLKGAPHVDERLYECRAVVTGTESEPLRVKIKKKRRCRRKKTVKSKHRYTMLRVSELRIREEAVHES
ncbi:ribosomal protein L21-like protein [Chaetomidium leptoderma]|uniref:Large ribosomal subunit protein bL21m n=1 Tax=Chaetomidium leptoderma TaxID=669021 RepID=A0AAN6ZWY9_9PEZI|nr:ribosomal protein L21-like protein [Chaetomidium leptoderma]